MKPILFNTEMVLALLDGRKTVTRRPVKGIDNTADFLQLEDNPSTIAVDKRGMEYPKELEGLYADFVQDGNPEYPLVKASYRPSDILYVRETWNSIRFGNGNTVPFHTEYWYKADDTSQNPDDKWHPSIHMPREAARIFLRVKEVRVERLQEITEDGILAEGIKSRNLELAKIDFEILWNRTVRHTDYLKHRWAANPWVWVIEFERITKEEAEDA